MPWYVLYTKPKAEKKVAVDLAKIGINTYCPTVVVLRQWSDRKKKVEQPLFSSYVFVQLDEKERDRVFAVKGVVRYLYWLGQPAVVKNEEIQVIQDWLGNSQATFETESIKPGDELVIAQGPFRDQCGIVQEVGKHTIRLVLPTIGVVLTMRLQDGSNH